MLDNQIHFFQYSGTGNTSIIAKEMIAVFSDTGFRVHSHPISSHQLEKIDPDVSIALAFPVAFQSTFPFIWDFFKNLPDTEGTQVFMVDTMMGYSGAIVGPLKKLLTKKGYVCIGAKEIRMPSNYFPKQINHEKNTQIIDRGRKQAREYAQELIHGKARWGRVPVVSDLFRALLFNPVIMNMVNLSAGKQITVDQNRCKQCGLCASLCPVGNIRMDGFPNFSDACQLCMRCICFCPEKAIFIPGRNFERYRAVSVDNLSRCDQLPQS
jgi:ferredoxin/flavodoxin